jgi:YD repeat-containing protein
VDVTYDSMGNLTSRRHREQDTSTNASTDILHQWGFTGNFVTSHTDPLGNQWTYGRDSAGNLTSVTHPTVSNPASQSASESWTYNSKGQVTRYTNEEGKHLDISYFTTGSSSDLVQEAEEDSAGLSLVRAFTYDSASAQGYHLSGLMATGGCSRGRPRERLMRSLMRFFGEPGPSEADNPRL